MSAVDRTKVVKTTRIYTRIEIVYLMEWVSSSLFFCKIQAASEVSICTWVQPSRVAHIVHGPERDLPACLPVQLMCGVARYPFVRKIPHSSRAPV
jgi:hypothetical protein